MTVRPLTDYEELGVVQEMDVDDLGHHHVYLLANSIIVMRTRHRPDSARVWSVV